MKVEIEHVNMHVKDIDQMVNFISAAFPEFLVRHDSGTTEEERWVHIGNGYTYLALYQASKKALGAPEPYSGRPGINHLGYKIDDAQALRLRMLGAGYRETTLENNHPGRKRVYFADPEGNDWEFVEYLVDDLEIRNDYVL